MGPKDIPYQLNIRDQREKERELLTPHPTKRDGMPQVLGKPAAKPDADSQAKL